MVLSLPLFRWQPAWWSSVYPCCDHSQLGSSQPTPVAITAPWWSQAYPCCNNSHPGSPQPNPVVQPTPAAFWDNMLVISLPPKQSHDSDGPQPISRATTVLCLSSAFCYRTHSRLDGSQSTPIATKVTLSVVSITLKPSLVPWCPLNYPCSHKGTIVVHNPALWSAQHPGGPQPSSVAITAHLQSST